jgi:hypothetical protein
MKKRKKISRSREWSSQLEGCTQRQQRQQRSRKQAVGGEFQRFNKNNKVSLSRVLEIAKTTSSDGECVYIYKNEEEREREGADTGREWSHQKLEGFNINKKKTQKRAQKSIKTDDKFDYIRLYIPRP